MIAELVDVISQVETMGGEPLTEILASSEIRMIAEKVLHSGLLGSAQPAAAAYPPHLAWMGSIPPLLHDCFSS